MEGENEYQEGLKGRQGWNGGNRGGDREVLGEEYGEMNILTSV